MIKKGKSGCGIKRMFRDGLAGLGKNAEKVKDDVAPRMKKATEALSSCCCRGRQEDGIFQTTSEFCCRGRQKGRLFSYKEKSFQQS